jgi:hypothetical protein
MNLVGIANRSAIVQLGSQYAHLGFAETYRAMEKGFHRVYLRLTLPEGRQ